MAVDSKNNGSDLDDPIIISVPYGGNQTDVGFQTGLNADTLVSVRNDRTGLSEEDYTLDNPGTFGSLCPSTYSDATTWGDLAVLEMRLDAGL